MHISSRVVRPWLIVWAALFLYLQWKSIIWPAPSASGGSICLATTACQLGRC